MLVILLEGFSLRGNLLVGLARWGVHDTWLRQIDRLIAGVGDGSCGGLEDGHQETEGVPLEGRCGNALLRRMLSLTDCVCCGRIKLANNRNPNRSSTCDFFGNSNIICCMQCVWMLLKRENRKVTSNNAMATDEYPTA